jgi:hypothetical protein
MRFWILFFRVSICKKTLAEFEKESKKILAFKQKPEKARRYYGGLERRLPL